jgi:hypothetical protein
MSWSWWLVLFLVMNFRDAIVSSMQALGEDVDIQSTFIYHSILIILAHISIDLIAIASDHQIMGFFIFMWRFLMRQRTLNGSTVHPPIWMNSGHGMQSFSESWLENHDYLIGKHIKFRVKCHRSSKG